MLFTLNLISKIILILVSVFILKKVSSYFVDDSAYKTAVIVAGIVGFVEFILGLLPYNIMPMIVVFVSIFLSFFLLKYYYFIDGKTALKIEAIWYILYIISGVLILFFMAFVANYFKLV